MICEELQWRHLTRFYGAAGLENLFEISFVREELGHSSSQLISLNGSP